MRVLFVTTGSQVTVYAVAPLATAVRNAGHELILATNEPLLEFAENLELPAVCVAKAPIRSFVAGGPPPGIPAAPQELRAQLHDSGRGFAAMSLAWLDGLLDAVADWTPDVVVGGSMSYAAGLLAGRLNVPYVRHAEYLRIPILEIDAGAVEGLRPELDRLGHAGLPVPDLFIESCPPSLRAPSFPATTPMRWIPRNPQRRLETWMYTRPKGRRRVLITSGTHFRMLPAASMRSVVDALAATGAEVLVAAPARTAEELGPVLGDVRVGWMPLDVVSSTCDLVLHHGGATTTMTILSAGTPQVILPPNVHTQAISRSLVDFGAALEVLPGPVAPGRELVDQVVAACREVLADETFAHRAQALAQENATLTTPAAMVPVIEALRAA
jgi:UDP:flavonoid glycosyltransferase YjiC (YdhE family)